MQVSQVNLELQRTERELRDELASKLRLGFFLIYLEKGNHVF